MQLIRWFLGKLILLVDTLFSPKGLKRSPEAQNKVDDRQRATRFTNLPLALFASKFAER